jgi:hypothetical protein
MPGWYRKNDEMQILEGKANRFNVEGFDGMNKQF